MPLELTDPERDVPRRALSTCVSDLREENTKTGKPEWLALLRRERTILAQVIERLNTR